MTSVAPSSDSPIVIVGAGIIGVSTALNLQRLGRQVLLVDRNEPGEGTSFGNAGVLASSSITPVTHPKLPQQIPQMLLRPNSPLFVKWRSLVPMLPWLVRYLSHCTASETQRISVALHGLIGSSYSDHKALAAGTEAERFVKSSEYTFVYKDKAPFLSEATTWKIRHAHGHRWREMQEPELRSYDSALSQDFKFGVACLDHGFITDPGEYVKALAKSAAKHGAEIKRGTVEKIICENGQATGLRVDGETIPASDVVICSGAWSAKLVHPLGVKVPLQSERGYHLDLWSPNIMPQVPTMIAAGKFVATPMEGRLRFAGVLEFGGLNAPRSKAPLRLLERLGTAAFPGLSWQHKTEWMGHRPATSDSLPLLGSVPQAAGVWLGFGHHHIGLTAGAKTGLLLAQMVTGQTPNVDISPYAPARFCK